MKVIVMIFGAVFSSIFLIGCNSESALTDAALHESSHFNTTEDYNRALVGLLSKPWVLEKEISVWHKDVSSASATPDLKEVRELRISNVNDLDLVDIGLEPGLPLATIYGGPFKTKVNNIEHAFVLTCDHRTWGYDHVRCYTLSKAIQDLTDSNVPSVLRSISYKDALAIKNNARIVLSSDFGQVDEVGKEMLNELSSITWNKSITLEMRSPLMGKTYPVLFEEKWSFNFWDNFSVLEYTHGYHKNGSNKKTSAPKSSKIEALGMRRISDRIVEFQIWATRKEFVEQSAVMMSFPKASDKLWSAKSEADIDSFISNTLPMYYCYAGWDCSKRLALIQKVNMWEINALSEFIAANFIVIRYDQDRPDELGVQYHMVDPRFNSLSTTFHRSN